VSFVISLSTEILILKIRPKIIPAINVNGSTIAIIITNKSGRLMILLPDVDVATNLDELILLNKFLIVLLMLLPLIENILLVAIMFFV